MDAYDYRGIERLVVAGGAIFLIYLGYRLYVKGLSSGAVKGSADTTFMKFAVSGTGPGILFMCFGALVLALGLLTGGGETTKDLALLKAEPPPASQTSAERDASSPGLMGRAPSVYSPSSQSFGGGGGTRNRVLAPQK